MKNLNIINNKTYYIIILLFIIFKLLTDMVFCFIINEIEYF